MSVIASIKFNIRIESEFKTQLFEANSSSLKFTIRQMNHKDVVNTYPITNDFYVKVDGITMEWAGMYNNYNVKDGISWDLNIIYDDGKKRIASGMNEYPKNYDELTDYLDNIIKSNEIKLVLCYTNK